MSEELKPCPFCGGEAEIVWEYPVLPNGKKDTLYRIECRNRRCRNRTNSWYPLEGATAAWNRRVWEEAVK